LSTIKFHNNGISPEIKNKQQLKHFLASIFLQEKVDFESVSYIFCKDKYLLDLNLQYLNHESYTDIITFTLSEKSAPLTAEVYISVERVRQNSDFLKVNYNDELRRVMIHGILHLCGFLDHSLKEKRIMRQKEDFYLYQYSST
jgi:probable rRNA maturation factor